MHFKASITKRKKTVLIAIFLSEQGILVTCRNDGQYQLPGGNVRYSKDGSKKDEIDSISQIIFEQCGLSLDLDDSVTHAPMRLANCEYRIYSMVQNSTPGNPDWKRNKRFEGSFLPYDLKQIIALYPNLSWHDLLIIAQICFDIDDKTLRNLKFKAQVRQTFKVIG